ncbi:MAG: hypothetical protein MJA30_22365 [Cytophagales bacterium]|nr:hypothetical protein [Cytophagales bacterium]
MAIISKKKRPFLIKQPLRNYLMAHSREIKLPIRYTDLLRYNDSIPLIDKNNKDTFWESVFYPQADMMEIHNSLKKIYAILKANGDLSVMKHLFVDRIDLCVYGNTQPFRIRIVNEINDNFDYFYIKNADASRVYGLELEHLLSPNRINYVVNDSTLIEEHILGIPGDQFIKFYLNDKRLNRIRFAKEFVKFNERCFVRLLGDMHANNFVIDMTPDFEDVNYRIRAIDFDQQSYEGRKAIYLPQYFKRNNPLINIGLECLSPPTVKQYQKEERSLIARRYKASKDIINQLLNAMSSVELAPKENLFSLRDELAHHYKDTDFLQCSSMGELVRHSLERVLNGGEDHYTFPK